MAERKAGRGKSLIQQGSFWKWTYGVWFVTLCILSSMSQPGPNVDIVGFDKVVHFTYFACGGLALGLALSLPKPERRRIRIMVLIVGALVGWFDEWHQSFTPGRMGLDVYDWVADVLGSAFAAMILPRTSRRLLSRI